MILVLLLELSSSQGISGTLGLIETLSSDCAVCSHDQLLVVLLETTVLYITFRGADISYRWSVAFQIISSQFGLPQMEPSHVGTSELSFIGQNIRISVLILSAWRFESDR